MLVYKGTKGQFVQDVLEQRLAEKVKAVIAQKMHRTTQESEYRSWENSMPFMKDALELSGVPDDCGIAIEYNIPLTSKRVDFIVSGYDEAGTAHADVVELKQWSEAKAVPGTSGLVETFTGGANRIVTHPSYQAWSYAACISNFNATVQDKQVGMHPCAYAHNYEISGSCALEAPEYEEYLHLAPLFGKHEVKKVARFLGKHIKKGDKGAVLQDIDCGKIRPSKSLQDTLPSLLEGNPEFVLIDDQKVVFERALYLARQAKQHDKKIVYIVKGGPGTGKSVVAVNLLARLIGEGLMATYVTKNGAPRAVYSAELAGEGKSKKEVGLLFKNSDSFDKVQRNAYDALLVDEAHRLVERGQYQPGGTIQIATIINAARCSVFFIDESQRVTFKDAGTVDGIRHYAKRLGATIYEDELTSQFRCNGSDGYLAWLDDTLGIRETANWSLEGSGYDFQVFDSPAAMQAAIHMRNGRNKARLVAGYCWDWPKASQNDTYAHDIQIGDWGISWNLAYNSQLFAIDDTIDEAGCIHTVQGLEFDYVGVIIGDDLRLEDGRVITDPSKRAKTDKSLNGYKKLLKEDPARAERIADQIIRNTYRTLMTRGMKGCYVYCTDAPLAAYLRERSCDFDAAYGA